MKEVYFKQIMIADLQNKTARVQPFEKGLNVVTSIDNHVGKSSLLKSLYYTLGAEVDFDSVWDRQSKLNRYIIISTFIPKGQSNLWLRKIGSRTIWKF